MDSGVPGAISAFWRDGRIVTMPARQARRRALLDHFEPGVRYPEHAVDDTLKRVIDDHCALRRYLVDEELLARTPDGTYWRSGGQVDVG
jgi:hypothetical protein